jgi:hypothetical protein
MAFARLPINSLSGGVGRQAPTKRLATEAENIDNCLVTLERSIEKRPPLSKVSIENTSYFQESNITPPTGLDFNDDNLYFHFLDIDGYNRYCIIVNRAGYSFNPYTLNKFSNDQNVELNISNFVSVYRIEPTEWIKETVSLATGPIYNDNGFNRGIFEYLTFGNKNTTTSYRVAGNNQITTTPTSTLETFGSIDYNVGIILWNKLIPLDFLPNNASKDLTLGTIGASNWVDSLGKSQYIHSGDKINYKIAAPDNSPTFENEDPTWKNVRDDIVYLIDEDTLEEEEVGQNLENFTSIPQYPITEVQNDVIDENGYKSKRTLYHLYDYPYILNFSNTIDWNTDQYYISSPLPKLNRDNDVYGSGKVYYARNPYLSFQVGFYRATRYTESPYFERIRTEDSNSVFDHRRFPLNIFKDVDGVWKVKHLELQPRSSGSETTNPGPIAVKRKDKIQSMAFWKNRLWVATDSTIFSSSVNNFFNFWIEDISNIVDTDVIDIAANVGSYNRLTHIVPFQNILFVSTAGSVQFEVRGGSIDVGISPFNVEFRPTSFYSTSKLTTPYRMGNNIFFLDNGKMYMYIGGNASGDEFSSSMEMSAHCKGYLPENIGVSTVSSSSNSVLFVDNNNKNHIYFYTLRINENKIVQNAFYKWILDENDEVIGLKSYEKDLYILAKRPSGISGKDILVPYFVSLETVPIETPMIDWLHKIETSDMVYSNKTQTTTITLPFYDPNFKYIIKYPDNAWGSEAYEAIELTDKNVQTVVLNNNPFTIISVGQKLNDGPIYIGRKYEMNVELSQQVRRAEDTNQIYDGVLNLKRITTKHFNTGAYDIEIQRKNRETTKASFFPVDINNILTRTDQLLIDETGKFFSKILAYSDACKIFIKSSYPTPCNISNIEIIGTFRLRNTSIE